MEPVSLWELERKESKRGIKKEQTALALFVFSKRSKEVIGKEGKEGTGSGHTTWWAMRRKTIGDSTKLDRN